MSWGAVFAGFVIAVALQITLTVLGMAIGLTALGGQDDPQAFGIGAAIWAILVPLVSLFVGGMIAGRMSHVHSNGDAFLHGALVWALSLLLAAWMLTTGVSRVLGGTLSFASDAASGALAGAGAAASRPGIQSDAQQAANQVDQQQLQQELQQAQRQAGQVADQAQDVAAGGAWGAMAALALSLLAAYLGARMGRHDPEPDTVIV